MGQELMSPLIQVWRPLSIVPFLYNKHDIISIYKLFIKLLKVYNITDILSWNTWYLDSFRFAGIFIALADHYFGFDGW